MVVAIHVLLTSVGVITSILLRDYDLLFAWYVAWAGWTMFWMHTIKHPN